MRNASLSEIGVSVAAITRAKTKIDNGRYNE